MTEIQEVIEKAKRLFKEWWYRSLAVTVAAVLGFSTGTLVKEKNITEDCKFMGVFRDGAQAYNCQPRVR